MLTINFYIVSVYADIAVFITIQIKANFEANMVWADSEFNKGISDDLKPCAKPGCRPFPQCCTTDPSSKSSHSDEL